MDLSSVRAAELMGFLDRKSVGHSGKRAEHPLSPADLAGSSDTTRPSAGLRHSFRLRKFRVLLLAITFASLTLTARADLNLGPGFDEEMTSLLMQSIETGQRSDPDQVLAIFLRQFEGSLQALVNLSIGDAELEELFGALSTAISAPEDQRFINALFEATTELDRRSVVPAFIRELPFFDHPAQPAYKTLIGAHAFDVAERLAALFPDHIQPLELVMDTTEDFDPTKPAVLTLMDDGPPSRLVATNLPIQQGRWLLAVVHPGCWFSLEAMRWIEQHSENIGPMLPENTVWVSPQHHLHTFTHVQETWNQTAELINIVFAYRNAAWPPSILINFTPTFYLLEEGEIIASVSGWDEDKGPDELMALFAVAAESTENAD